MKSPCSTPFWLIRRHFEKNGWWKHIHTAAIFDLRVMVVCFWPRDAQKRRALESSIPMHISIRFELSLPQHWLTCYGGFLVGITNAKVTGLVAVCFHHFSNNIPDQPGDKGNDYLNNAYDQPENAHDQVKDKLHENKNYTTESNSRLAGTTLKGALSHQRNKCFASLISMLYRQMLPNIQLNWIKRLYWEPNRSSSLEIHFCKVQDCKDGSGFQFMKFYFKK